jgi:Zn-finger nucleic acid-binding protein
MFVGHPALARATEAAHADTARREETTAAPRFEREVHYAKCPRCAQVMSRVNFGHRSGVLVDSCRVHGTWFDAGELDAVLAFVARGGLEERVTAGTSVNARDAGGKDIVARASLQMESALAMERLNDVKRIEEATDFVDDLLSFILPGDRYSDFRRRRRW